MDGNEAPWNRIDSVDIDDARTRQVGISKRKSGVMEKAKELISANQKPVAYVEQIVYVSSLLKAVRY